MSHSEMKSKFYNEDGVPAKVSVEYVLDVLRGCYRYIDNEDYSKSVRKFFKEVSPISYTMVLRLAKRNNRIAYALSKIKELEELRQIEKCYKYLEDMLEYFKKHKDIVFIGDYFEEHGEFNRGLVEHYAKKNEAIQDLWDEILSIQESRLVRLLLENGKFNKGIVFILKNLHGWKEKVEVEDKSIEIRVEKEIVKNGYIDIEGKKVADEERNEKVIRIEEKQGEGEDDGDKLEVVENEAN